MNKKKKDAFYIQVYLSFTIKNSGNEYIFQYIVNTIIT